MSNRLKFLASPSAESPCHGEESSLHWETVENILGLRDGIQVHSSFHTDVKELKYQDLLTSTFTLADHDIYWGAKDGYPQCAFCGHGQHVDHCEHVICQSWEKYATGCKATRRPCLICGCRKKTTTADGRRVRQCRGR